MRPVVYAGLRARSLEGQRAKERERIEVRRKKGGKREIGAYGRAGGLPGFRQEDVTVNPRPPASDEPTLSASQGLPRSLLLLLLRPVRTCYAYTRTYTRGGKGGREEGRQGAHLYTLDSIVELFAERIVIAFFAMVRNGLTAREGPASLRRDERQG